MSRVSCVIPTYNGKNDLKRLLDSLDRQTLDFDIIIIDSSSGDGTLELARSRVKNVAVIASVDFNHGGTRQKVIDDNPYYDIYVYLTQDAYMAGEGALSAILAPFEDPKVAAVCGRQLPHLDATPLAAHARLHNYPPVSRVRSLEDASRMGLKAAFMSNSFAAYRKTALLEVGGFPNSVIFGEDMYATAELLAAGYKVAYAGDAQCHHSHNYTLVEEFRRYFDIGVFHSRERWMLDLLGGVSGEGVRYVLSELKFLGLKHILLWPNSIIRNVIKYLAYRIGKKESKIPLSVKIRLSMNKKYWLQ